MVTGQQIKGTILFWVMVISIIAAAVTGHFTEAGGLVATLIVGVVAYQALGWGIKGLTGGRWNPFNVGAPPVEPLSPEYFVDLDRKKAREREKEERSGNAETRAALAAENKATLRMVLLFFAAILALALLVAFVQSQ